MISIFKEKKIENSEYPFISIDGGLFRESSYIFNSIIDISHKSGSYGFSEYFPIITDKTKPLSKSQITNFKNYQKTLFNSRGFSEYIKKNFEEMLTLNSNNNNNQNYNIYYPNTEKKFIGGDSKLLNKYSTIYDKFTNKRIITMIYMHKTSDDCKYIEKYTCQGCNKLGKKRSIGEGKAYSSMFWKPNYIAGLFIVKNINTNYYKLIIHNSGSADKLSIIIDHGSNIKLFDESNEYTIPNSKNIKYQYFISNKDKNYKIFKKNTVKRIHMNQNQILNK